MDAAKMGMKIAKLRKANGLTQEALANKLHVTNRAVSKWENGLNFPDLSLMESLAANLGITVTELLDLDEKAPENAFEIAVIISEGKKEQLQKRIRHGLVTIVVLSAFVVIYAILALMNAENWTNGLRQITLVYGIAIIVWAIELLIHFQRLHKK